MRQCQRDTCGTAQDDALGRDKNDNSSRYGKIAQQHSHNAVSDAFVHGNACPSKSNNNL